MHLENTERLFKEFPDLFHREQLIHGFECQDGWFELICRFAARIRGYGVQSSGYERFAVVQVKQEVGRLLLDIRGGDPFIRKLIEEAEQESQSICELDGEPATGLYVCAPSWYRYL